MRPWRGRVGHVSAATGVFAPGGDGGGEKLVATGGMRALADALAADIAARGGKITRPCWVSDMDAHDGSVGWSLRGNRRQQGVFDHVVIAHNGKCANQLLSTAGVPQVAAQMAKLRLSAVWVALVAFAAPVATVDGWEGAFVDGSSVLSWVANNSAKLRAGRAEASVTSEESADSAEAGRPVTASAAPDVPSQEGVECWTLISTGEFGRRNKVPQENIPPQKAEQVRRSRSLHAAQLLAS